MTGTPLEDDGATTELAPDPELMPGAIKRTGRSDESANSSSETFAPLDD